MTDDGLYPSSDRLYSRLSLAMIRLVTVNGTFEFCRSAHFLSSQSEYAFAESVFGLSAHLSAHFVTFEIFVQMLVFLLTTGNIFENFYGFSYVFYIFN